ncbi:sulfotransferase family 2 domain-containing protein [Undibacterium fentianense]|uniref:Sulfotransferase family 2 domain-containing protein n=1 Tax=Undibacterium fentianense TaxID=2828728 RepID=A0A941IGP4_9BURK|nr:sulfotransferase family 2 domain-containing protein [Undibacterium fentianense]MBR7801557.1 sulfotransferase family 2 domain-containing protein [Undibacterium fentianense]
MIISHQHRLVILFPWKTASQTIRFRLKHLDQSPYPKSYHFNPYLQRVVHQHITLADFSLLPEAQLGYRLAVFVRNPYDRVYSGFQQILRDALSQPKWQLPASWIHQLVTQQLADNFEEICRSSFDINRWFAQLPLHKILELGRNSSLYLHPCSYWTHRVDQLVVDFVGKVESFEEDFARLCELYGLEPASTVSVNQTPASELPKVQAIHGFRYAKLFEPQNIEKINAVFKSDFVHFNYPILTP